MHLIFETFPGKKAWQDPFLFGLKRKQPQVFGKLSRWFVLQISWTEMFCISSCNGLHMSRHEDVHTPWSNNNGRKEEVCVMWEGESLSLVCLRS